MGMYKGAKLLLLGGLKLKDMGYQTMAEEVNHLPLID